MLSLLAASPTPGLDPSLVAAVSLSLLVGGLAMIGVVIVVTVVSNALPMPARASAIAAGKGSPRRVLSMPDVGTAAISSVPRASAVAMDDLQRGRLQGARLKVKRVDDVLDYVSNEGLADPRILNVRTGMVRLAFVHCSECRDGDQSALGCGYRVGLLEGALGQLHRPVAVHEVACHRRGDPLCEFEVTFG